MLVPCDTRYGEDTTIFELDVSDMVNDGEEGVFRLDYPCNMGLADPLGEGLEFKGREKAVKCEYCLPENVRHVQNPRFDRGGRLFHCIQLIYVPLFLAHHPDRARYAGAMKQAELDREWLIYPVDYVHRLKGNAAQVQLADFWRVTRYKIIRTGGV